MKKSVSTLLLAATLSTALVGCGDKTTTEGGSTGDATTPASTESTLYPEEKVIIAVETYDTTDSEYLALQDYFTYLSENFNVEFKYSESIADAEMEMKFVEDAAIAGAKGYFAYYDVSGAELVNKALEYDMYFYGLADTPEIYEQFKENPLYLGSLNYGDMGLKGGKALGEWVVEQGFDKVIYANGGADFGVGIFVDRQKGFLDGIGDANVEVITVSGFPGEQFFADQAAALATEGVDAVVASFNGVDFWAQPIATAGLTEVKLATFGAVNQAYVDAFKNGAVDLVVAQNIQTNGMAIPMIINAVNGDADKLKENGLATNEPGAMWIIEDAETAEKLNNIQNNEKVYTAEDLTTLISAKNPEASHQTIIDLVEKSKLENLLK